MQVLLEAEEITTLEHVTFKHYVQEPLCRDNKLENFYCHNTP